MRSRLVMVLAAALAAVSVTLVVSRLTTAASARRPVAVATLTPGLASYLGVYESTALQSYAQILEFGRAAGREPNIAGYFSGWPEPFKIAFARSARAHGAAVLVQLDPTDASIQGIAAGAYDDYLRSFADAVARFGSPVVIGFGHEMNATWYSWGFGHVRPATFVAAWRHIVAVFRGQGADNVTWLWTIQANELGTGPIRSWWPGPQYVTWVGIDGYYFRPGDTFARVFAGTIAQVRSFTTKPILLSETAVGPEAGQPAKIHDLFRGMADYQTLGLVWFDISQHDGIYHQDWRIEDSRAAQYAVEQAVREYIRAADREYGE
jgi:mannan endo-1,4-beta-mannosidase